MKTICNLLLSIALIVFSCFEVSAQSDVKKKVAVYITGDDVENSVKKIIGAKLVTAITASGEYAAVERTADFLAALEKESDYQTSGEVRDSQIAKLGQKFGVRFVVVADVSEAFDELFVASRLINVETGLVERAYDASGPAESMPQLIKLSQEVAAGLLNGIIAPTTPASGRTTTTKKTQSGQHEKVDLGLPSGRFTDYSVKFDGKEHRLSDIVGRGDYVLVDFWASWCGPCRQEMPYIKEAYKRFKDKNFRVLGQAVSDRPEDTFKAATAMGLPWTIWPEGDNEAAKAYDITTIPRLILFGPDGTILSRELHGETIIPTIAAYLE